MKHTQHGARRVILRPNHFHKLSVRKQTTDDHVFVDINAFLDLNFVRCARCSVSQLVPSETTHL